jgi:pSer/pThr/pTyr-binding forkhead associated (FHA) protein
VVAIDDPERSISKVHLAFGLEPDGRLWVMDRGSTNGTVVVGPDGRSAALVAGSRATVAPGWTVRFGRRTVQVTRR